MTPGELLKTQLQPNPQRGGELIVLSDSPPPALPVNRWIQFSSKGFVSRSCVTLCVTAWGGGQKVVFLYAGPVIVRHPAPLPAPSPPRLAEGLQINYPI